MKTFNENRWICIRLGLLLAAITLSLHANAQTTDIFTPNFSGGVNEYAASGTTATTVAAPLFSVNNPSAIAVDGDDVFVTNFSNPGSVGEFTTSGATVNSNLISNIGNPIGIATDGNYLYVVCETSAQSPGVEGEYVSQYTLSGQLVNQYLISGLGTPYCFASDGMT